MDEKTPKIVQMTVEMGGQRQVLVAKEDAPDQAPLSNGQRRSLFAMTDALQMDRMERLEFSEQLLQKDIGSWKYLTAHDASRLIDALNGYVYVSHILSEKPPTDREMNNGEENG